MTIGTLCALALAVFAVAPQISAQSGSSPGKGIFSSLRVGNMVEFTDDQLGSWIITTYEDDEKKPFMRHKVKEIGHDYLTLEFDDRNGTGSIAETRIPVARLSMLAHVGKSHAKGGAPADDPLSDKPGKANTKPGAKKKN
jgi:hypothetical protein